MLTYNQCCGIYGRAYDRLRKIYPSEKPIEKLFDDHHFSNPVDGVFCYTWWFTRNGKIQAILEFRGYRKGYAGFIHHNVQIQKLRNA